MAKEYRFKGIGAQGKLVQGTFMADSGKAAKPRIHTVLPCCWHRMGCRWMTWVICFGSMN